MVRKQLDGDGAMDKKRAAKHDDPEQSKRFLKAAQEHQAATTEEAARLAFRKVVGKPKPRGR